MNERLNSGIHRSQILIMLAALIFYGCAAGSAYQNSGADTGGKCQNGADVGETVVGLTTNGSRSLSGQGVIIEPGVVLTVFHNIRRRTEVNIYFNDRLYPATVTSSLPAYDLALLTFDQDLPTPNAVMPKDYDYSIGDHFRVIYRDLMTRRLRNEGGEITAAGPMRFNHNAQVAFGVSGAPLFDDSCRLIGIFKGIKLDKEGNHDENSIRYSVPISAFLRERPRMAPGGLFQHYVIPATEVTKTDDGEYAIHGIRRVYELDAEGMLDLYTIATWHYQVMAPLIGRLRYNIKIVDDAGNLIEHMHSREAELGAKNNGHNSINKWRLKLEAGKCYDVVVVTNGEESARESFCVSKKPEESPESDR